MAFPRRLQPPPCLTDMEDLLRRGQILHRGGAPENSLAALRRAKAENAAGVEVDVMLTKDGHCVLLHDETVDRTSDGSGRVRDMTLQELRRLRFEGGQHIATVEEAVSLCEELDLIIFLDIKPFNTDKDLQKLLYIFEENPQRYQRVCIISFYITTLYKLRRMDSRVLCGLCLYCNSLMSTVDGIERRQWWAGALSPIADWLLFQALDGFLLNFVGIRLLLLCKDDIISKRMALGKWRREGRNIVAWTVNTRGEKEYFERESIPFFTDSIVEDVPEAWIPPKRCIVWSDLANNIMPLVIIIILSLVWFVL